jgi:putative membrane protein
MVLSGEGLAALKTVLLSCLLAALLAVALFVPSLGFFPIAYEAVKPYMKYALLAVSLVLVGRGRHPPASAAVFVAAGMLGTFALHTDVYDPFLPLFSGMFAMAAIATYRRTKVPEQKDSPIGFGFAKFVAVGVLLGMLADILPGIGSPAQVATFATMLMPLNTAGYLATISSISVSQAVFSLSTSASIDKSRVGATAWLSQAMEIGDNLPLLLALFVLGIALASLAAYSLRGKIAMLASLDFSKANVVIALYLAAITMVLDGGTGLLILIVSTALGWLTIRLGVERTTLMGAIIVPTLLLLFGVYV